MRQVLAIAAVSSLSAALVALPLAWDGSYLLFRVLNEQSPLYIHHRLVESVLTSPVLLTSWITDDLGLLRFMFCLPYAAVPFVSLACCSIVARRRPELFVWPTLGIGVALLPGLAMSTSEQLIAAELSWPLLLAAIVPSQQRLVFALCLALGVLVAVSHPIALPLLLAVGVIGAVARRRSSRAAAAWIASFVGLAVINVAELTSRLTPFERESLEPSTVVLELVRGVFGPPLAALPLAALAAVLVHRAAHATPTARHRELHDLALVTLTLVGVTLLTWAALPSLWRGEVDFRAWALPVTLPFFVLTWLDARRALAGPPRALVEQRMKVARAAASVMCLVLVVQGIAWTQLTSRVSVAVAGPTGCVDAGSIDGFPDSPLGHWAITPLSIVLQARDVHAFVATADSCGISEWPREVPMGPVPALTPAWFRFHD
jgi:hypothetical protein